MQQIECSGLAAWETWRLARVKFFHECDFTLMPMDLGTEIPSLKLHDQRVITDLSIRRLLFLFLPVN